MKTAEVAETVDTSFSVGRDVVLKGAEAEAKNISFGEKLRFIVLCF